MRNPRKPAAGGALPALLLLACSQGGATLGGRAPLLSAAVAETGPATDGLEGPDPWVWSESFARSTHVSAIRARFGSTLSGVPIRYRWERRACDRATFEPIPDASEDRGDPRDGTPMPLPRTRTWFADVDACAVRLVVFGTNHGAPALEDVQILEGAEDVLRHATVTSAHGAEPEGLVDGTYEGRFVGTAGLGRWTIDVALPRPEVIDRVRLVLGADATSIPRATLGRSYAVARTPLAWTLFGSDDGVRFETLATAPRDATGRALLVRRPLVTLDRARTVRFLRLVLDGATNEQGLASASASPVVRALEAFREDDARPILREPWVLSVNANPKTSLQGSSSLPPETAALANDTYYAKFLQLRFTDVSIGMARDDRYARALGVRGELVPAERGPSDGRALEAIEGDDPALGEAFLRTSWPPPIMVLSGSNDWDYARRTTFSPQDKTRWNPMLDAAHGGMGNLTRAVKERLAPFVGFCGGAQILALLEAKTDGSVDGHEIDAILRRNTGRAIRGAATSAALIRAWPGETSPRSTVTFDPADPLFRDIAGPSHRAKTRAFPQSHLDLVRPDAFLPGRPLERLEIVASSTFCSGAVLASLRPANGAQNKCVRITEVFRTRGQGWPIVGAQFHAEQRDFTTTAGDDPPESVADARLFLAAIYQNIVDAQLAR